MRRVAPLLACALIALPAYAADDATVARGRYLADVAGCGLCHTDPGGASFTGGRRIATPYGGVWSSNLTPEPTSGLANWTDDDFVKAVRGGVDPKGVPVNPAMPFAFYARLSVDDTLALRAYLATIPPKFRNNRTDNLQFPHNLRASTLAWRERFFVAPKSSPAPSAGDPRARGAYLAESVARCGACHDDRYVAGAPLWRAAYVDGVPQDVYVPNVAPDARTLAATWSEDKLAQFLRGPATAPPDDTSLDLLPVHRRRVLTDADAAAIATYIKTSPPPVHAAPASYGASAQVWLANCASCHGADGKGLPGYVPPLAGDARVAAMSARDVASVVLGGRVARDGAAPMTAVGMAMSDADVVAAIGDLRHRVLGVQGGDLTVADVAALRATIDTPMNPRTVAACGTYPEDMSRAINQPLSAIGPSITTMDRTDAFERTRQVANRANHYLGEWTRAERTNALTGIYCKQVSRTMRNDPAGRAIRLGEFSGLLYSELQPERRVFGW